MHPRCRVNGHSFAGIDTLDAWPNVKVRLNGPARVPRRTVHWGRCARQGAARGDVFLLLTATPRVGVGRAHAGASRSACRSADSVVQRVNTYEESMNPMAATLHLERSKNLRATHEHIDSTRRAPQRRARAPPPRQKRGREGCSRTHTSPRRWSVCRLPLAPRPMAQAPRSRARTQRVPHPSSTPAQKPFGCTSPSGQLAGHGAPRAWGGRARGHMRGAGVGQERAIGDWGSRSRNAGRGDRRLTYSYSIGTVGPSR